MQQNGLAPLRRYQYDALDRLVASSSPTQAAAVRFYQQEHFVTEIQGDVQRSIIQHDDQLLAQQQHQIGAITTDLLATDPQRSVLNVLKANRLHPLAYTTYGHCPPGNGLLSLLGFNGERADPVTGCYLLGSFRAFTPVLMRFNSPDSFPYSPFGQGGINAYAYCAGNPVNRADPTGHVLPFPDLLKFMSSSLRKSPSLTGQPTFTEGVIETLQHSLRRNSIESSSPMSPARKAIDRLVEPINDPQPFTSRLDAVNRNLHSNGNESISPSQVRKYESLVAGLQSGKISNAGAHLSAAQGWINRYQRRGSPAGVAGATANIGGMLVSGVVDQKQMKTGAWLRRSP